MAPCRLLAVVVQVGGWHTMLMGSSYLKAGGHALIRRVLNAVSRTTSLLWRWKRGVWANQAARRGWPWCCRATTHVAIVRTERKVGILVGVLWAASLDALWWREVGRCRR